MGTMNIMNAIKLTTALSAVLAMMSMPCLAGDQDDGIGFEKPIADDLQPDINISYILQKSKARAGSASSISGSNGNSAGVGNINLGPGSRLRNVTIINNSDNSGATAVNDR